MYVAEEAYREFSARAERFADGLSERGSKIRQVKAWKRNYWLYMERLAEQTAAVMGRFGLVRGGRCGK